MPESSIADEITRLSGCRNDILSAISAKGVTVPVGSVLSSCPSLIASIPTGGGGGDPTSMINSGFVGTGAISYVRPFTATQKSVPAYDTVTSSLSLTTAGSEYVAYKIKSNNSSFFALDGSASNGLTVSGSKAAWGDFPTGDKVYLSPTDAYQGGSSVGTWRVLNTTTDSFTAEAEFTGTSTVGQTYLVFLGMTPWSVTARNPVTGTIYVQTGTDIPYPQYSTVTQGSASSYISATESWTNRNGYYQPEFVMSGYNSVIYADGPTTSTTLNSSETLVAFARFSTSKNISSMLKSRIRTSVDTGYTYSYGAVASSYAGYTGA